MPQRNFYDYVSDRYDDEAVDEVEVYDKQSEIAEFTGIDDGEEEKTINLKLKEDHKQGGFGNLDAAGGI